MGKIRQWGDFVADNFTRLGFERLFNVEKIITIFYMELSKSFRYEGEQKDGMMFGYGILTTPDQEIGFQFIDNNPCGFGYCKKKHQTYYGEYVEEKKHGTGMIQYDSGAVYYGEVSEYVPHGKGCYTDNSGNSIMANFKNGSLDGYCITIVKETKIYSKFKNIICPSFIFIFISLFDFLSAINSALEFFK